MKKWLCLIITGVAAWSIGASALADSAPTIAAEPKGDVAKMYRVKHEMKFDLQGRKATLDGKVISAEKPILKGGRVYVPLRTLRQSGAAANVTWNADKREVQVVVHPELLSTFSQLTFRIGSEDVYRPDGKPIGDKIPAPFLSSGKAYVPIRALSWLGLAVSTVNDTVRWNWSDKVIEVLNPEWETDEASTTFTMLYQKDMYTPQYMFSIGEAGWLGGTGKLTQKDISMDGRLYNRIQFTVNLRPGPNPVMLTANSAGSKVVTVRRNVTNIASLPVTIMGEGKENIAFTSPTQGYILAEPNQKIDISGDILQHNDLYDKLTVSVEQYQQSSEDAYLQYEKVKSIEVPIKAQAFAGSFTLSEKGSYLIRVLSPAYISSVESRQMMTQWAEFVVDVE
ncbi:stalk domain-containing protein [Paenibacillus cineris]|uniref:stalk domain-containing protein n=1 Tax=Paenibacillus cineris TaxID=237530 RepID=UPI001BB38A16|nr:stalk domain-containing protein [Paenibacillus cineris]